jgi:hypothetical protein
MGEFCPAVGRGRDRFLAAGVEALRGYGRLGHSPASPPDRYEQPEQPHWTAGGGSSWSRTLSSSVRPSVSSACRVSSGRLSGSVDQALPLISITTCATSAPRVISQRQLRASAPARTCLPRFALISQPINPRLRQRVRRQAIRAGRPRRGPGWPSGLKPARDQPCHLRRKSRDRRLGCGGHGPARHGSALRLTPANGDHRPLPRRLAGQPNRDPDHFLMHVDPRHPRTDDIPPSLLCCPGTEYGHAARGARVKAPRAAQPFYVVHRGAATPKRREEANIQLPLSARIERGAGVADGVDLITEGSGIEVL